MTACAGCDGPIRPGQPRRTTDDGQTVHDSEWCEDEAMGGDGT